MPKKNLFSSKTPNLYKSKSKICFTAKSTAANKKRKSNNSLAWLQETYDSARGETALWVGVITQAMMDALTRSKKAEAIYQKHEAIIWLMGSSKDFAEVCLAAGMEPDYVRRKAKKVLAAPVPWRAEPGKGKRYEERKEYRKRLQAQVEVSQAQIISIY